MLPVCSGPYTITGFNEGGKSDLATVAPQIYFAVVDNRTVAIESVGEDPLNHSALALSKPGKRMNAYGQFAIDAPLVAAARWPDLGSVRASVMLAALLSAASVPTHVQAAKDMITLSPEQLLEVTIAGDSKYDQKQREVAAAVSVITRQEIKAFGLRMLGEAHAGLPGVHTIYECQYSYFGGRGFGFGLPGGDNIRALLTINGNRVNEPVFEQRLIGRSFPLDVDLIEQNQFMRRPGRAVCDQMVMFGGGNVITHDGVGADGFEAAVAYRHPQAMRDGQLSRGKRLDNGIDMQLSISAIRARGENRIFDFGAAGLADKAVGLDGVRGRFDLAQPVYEQKFAADTFQLLACRFAGRERFRNVRNHATALSFSAGSKWRGAELRLLSTAVANHNLLLGQEHQVNSTLSVAYSPGAAKRGVALNMAVLQNKIALEPNLQPARAAHLDLSSRQLPLAAKVQS